MSRKKNREEAFKALYAEEVAGKYTPEPRVDFTSKLVRGTRENQAEIDERLEEHLEDWRLDRIFPVEKVLLRMGLYEILWMDTGKAVVINEAVELAKKYGDEGTASFVNGILDNFKAEAK